MNGQCVSCLQVTVFGPGKAAACLDLQDAGTFVGSGGHFWPVIMTAGIRTFCDDDSLLAEGARGMLVIPAVWEVASAAQSLAGFIGAGSTYIAKANDASSWTVVGRRGGKSPRPMPAAPVANVTPVRAVGTWMLIDFRHACL